MKATDIIRRMYDLGRIVIPKKSGGPPYPRRQPDTEIIEHRGSVLMGYGEVDKKAGPLKVARHSYAAIKWIYPLCDQTAVYRTMCTVV